MSEYLSSKLTVLYTVLIVMVVYIHSYYPQGEVYLVADFLQNFTGPGLCRVANCLFFFISGYLFARNVTTLRSTVDKAIRRITHLLVPYVLWNLIFVLWYVVLDFVPGVSQFNNSAGTLDAYLEAPVPESLYKIFWVPAAFQLWFIRDLLVMFVFTPVLCYMARKSWAVSLLLAVVSVYFYGWLIYFWIGIIIGVNRYNIESLPKNIGIVAGLVYLTSSVATGMGIVFDNYLAVVLNLVSLYFVWTLYDVLARGRDLAGYGVFKYICGYSFFIYCFHEPTLNIFKKLALAVCGQSQASIIIFYYLNPIVMVIVAIAIAKLLKRYTPNVYSILTGGR